MTLKTGEQYIESMRKLNLQVYMFGKKWSVLSMIPFCGPRLILFV